MSPQTNSQPEESDKDRRKREAFLFGPGTLRAVVYPEDQSEVEPCYPGVRIGNVGVSASTGGAVFYSNVGHEAVTICSGTGVPPLVSIGVAGNESGTSWATVSQGVGPLGPGFPEVSVSHRFVSGHGGLIPTGVGASGSFVLMGAVELMETGLYADSLVVSSEERPVPEPHRRTASSDRAWFFEDPARVAAFAGMVVAVFDREIVGHGTGAEAVAAARESGIGSPLLLAVPAKEDNADFSIGL